jgi:glycosyltransferase involved in cell wall biosynthesis
VEWADEVVVVNDCSKDGTVNIARSFPNVRVIDRAMNENWSVQMNFGIEQATGDWMLQLDVDERVPQELAEELKQLAQPVVGSLLVYKFLELV